jgi:hypothetical protein
MENCLFCGAGVNVAMTSCGSCGAPVDKSVISVMIDLSGVKGKVQLSITKAPLLIRGMLPSRLFDMTFESQSAVLMYRGLKATSTGSSGAVAQGTNAVAVGAGAIYCGGNVSGNITVGDGNRIESRRSSAPHVDEPIIAGLFLPAGISYIVINGNGNTNCQIDYMGAEVIVQNATVL